MSKEYNNQPTRPVVINTTDKPAGAYYPDQHTSIRLDNPPHTIAEFHPYAEPQPLAQADEAEVFGEPTKENKFWVLQAMGFAPRGNARWWHPVLGEDFPHNHLLFDLDTDDLKSLAPKLYRTGWVYGQRDIRRQFKKVLDI